MAYDITRTNLMPIVFLVALIFGYSAISKILESSVLLWFGIFMIFWMVINKK